MYVSLKQYRAYIHSTKCKDRATRMNDAELMCNMNAAIELWTKMKEADRIHDTQIEKNVKEMQMQVCCPLSLSLSLSFTPTRISVHLGSRV